MRQSERSKSVFDPEQFHAVCHASGPMLVLAGPGCGKTHTISGRVNRLIENGCSPPGILVATFTRAAAAEMRQRFIKDSKRDGPLPVFGTFHGIFYKILRSAVHIGSDNIFSETKKNRLLEELIKAYGHELSSGSRLLASVCAYISRRKEGESSARVYADAAGSFEKIYSEYCRFLSENGLFDYDDLCLKTLELFRENRRVLKAWQDQFEYILIDEFQDINRLQYEAVRMLAGERRNIFAVGDDDQSIYAFRGADPDLMREFVTQMPETEVVTLKNNYRSRGEITDAAVRMISRNPGRFEKRFSCARGYGGRAELVICGVKDEDEALAGAIKEALEKGVLPEEIAVLVRTNREAEMWSGICERAGIPVSGRGKGGGSFGSETARDIYAYLKLDPDKPERGLLLRIINKPKRYISRNAFYENPVTFDKIYRYYSDRDWMREKVKDLERDLRAIRMLPPFGAVYYIRKAAGYDRWIEERFETDPEKLGLNKKILDELLEDAKGYSSKTEWLDACGKRSAAEGTGDKDRTEGIVITTLHGSKGREFDTVLIAGVNDGNIPRGQTGTKEEFEEERRLLYVGMTRAKNTLLLFASKKKEKDGAGPSVFLKGTF